MRNQDDHEHAVPAGDSNHTAVERPRSLSIVEFYSGIGGLAHAFHASHRGSSLRPGKVIQAFDVNENANTVHAHNLPGTPVSTTSILGLTIQDLDDLAADIWLLSPPCQPFSRQGHRKGADDARALSFLSMLDVLPAMRHPPTYLLLENVLGFERDEATFARLLSTLDQCGFHSRSFAFNSLALGIPNSRPRFFLVARRSRHLPIPPSVPAAAEPPGLIDDVKWLIQKYRPDGARFPPTLAGYIDQAVSAQRSADLVLSNRHIWRVPAQTYDPVWPHESRSCCFTKAYGTGRPQGSGSVLVTNGSLTRADWTQACQEYLAQRPAVHASIGSVVSKALETELSPAQLDKVRQGKPLGGKLARMVDEIRSKAWTEARNVPECPLLKFGLRFFAPEEMAALHGFPHGFGFPDGLVSCKQGWKLVGNSLNVAVVSVLIDYLLDDADDNQD